jgi:sec-independent protein translocase protein TatC
MHDTRHEFDPDAFQMSIGDHLEELRKRIFRGLAGLIVAILICFCFGNRLVAIFCAPLFNALRKADVSTQLYVDELSDGFMTVIKISFIVALSLTSPWILYQLWQFVRSGLYPKERKYVTKYIPLSITLLISGMLFVYFLVLPWSIQFFISRANAIPLPNQDVSARVVSTNPSVIESLPGDPASPKDYQMWFDTTEHRLKMFVGGNIRVIPFGPDNLINTQFQLTDYLSLVLQLLLIFGLAFQLPLVVNALARLGIVEVSTLKHWRRHVYFGLCVLAAAISPGDLVTATVALLVPLIFLYELGIFLAQMGEKQAARAENRTT